LTHEPPRKSWGAGRVAFIARLDTIRLEMSQGYPLTTIFQRHQAALGIGYQSFCKLVSRYAGDARLVPRPASRPSSTTEPTPTPKPNPASSPVVPEPVLSSTERLPHARHEPAVRRTFNHDPLEKPDDRKRLLGEG
jgi:hypothetical protein